MSIDTDYGFVSADSHVTHVWCVSPRFVLAVLA
jgi:hypothetical protein